MLAITLKRNAAARWTSGLAVLIAAFLLLAGAASADTSMQTITSAGPLSSIFLGNQLSCQVQHTGDTSYEFYSPSNTTGSCGTLLSTGGTLYGPPVGTAYTAVSQSAVTGAGTTASPYSVTTTVTAGTAAQVQQTDSYVVGDESYLTTITVTNTDPAGATLTGFLYRGADCYLKGSDSGYGYAPAAGATPAASGPVACTSSANNTPPGPLEEFSPVTAGSHFVEAGFSAVWSDIEAQTDLADTCDCSTLEDNGMAVNWDLSIPPGQSATYSVLNNISDTGQFVAVPTAVTGSATPSSPTTASLTGSVNPNSSTVTDCHFDFGPTTAYGNTAPCAETVGGGTTAVPVSTALAGLTPGTTYHYRLSATNSAGPSQGSDQTVTTPAATPTTTTTTPPPPPTPPAVVVAAPVVSGASSAGLSGSVNPQGLVTTAHFEYGLDAQYSAGGTQVYDQTTPSQAVGSDFAAHAVSANVTGLVPNAVYDARLVATNSAGTVTGPNQTFTTDKAPTPSAPTLGQTTNLQLISGLVLVKPPGGSSGSARFPSATVDKGTGFVPLTQARQVPIGSQIDARRGVLELVDNSGQQRQNQSVHLAGGLFTVTQTKSGVQKGLTTLALNESAFPGAPSYKSCPSTGKLAHASAAGAAHAAGLSSKVLQTLRASDHNGKFRTKGRYSSGTVRGTDWGTQDLCDGTLTIVHRGTVDVNDFGLRKTIAVHAGHTYLAKPAAQDKNKKKKKK